MFTYIFYLIFIIPQIGLFILKLGYYPEMSLWYVFTPAFAFVVAFILLACKMFSE